MINDILQAEMFCDA